MADEKRIAELMKALDISREEAIEVLQDDDDIEHGKPKDFDLSEEKKKVAQKYTKSTTHKKSENSVKRERKPNEQKGALIQALYEFFTENCELSVENVEIVNKEKLITFKLGEENYKLDLIQTRKPKK